MSAKDNNTNTNIYRSYIDALLYPEQNPFIEDMKRFEELMMMYSCAIKEVQTKLDVLNTDFSVRYNRNPIEFIQSRTRNRSASQQSCLQEDVRYPWKISYII